MIRNNRSIMMNLLFWSTFHSEQDMEKKTKNYTLLGLPNLLFQSILRCWRMKLTKQKENFDSHYYYYYYWCSQYNRTQSVLKTKSWRLLKYWYSVSNLLAVICHCMILIINHYYGRMMKRIMHCYCTVYS